MKHFLFLTTGFSSLLLAVALDQLARSFYLYHAVFWLDLVVHFLASSGLITLALWSVFFSAWSGRTGPPPSSRVVLAALLLIVILGIFWEWFEYLKTDTFSTSYILDTGLDMAMNIAGALTAAWLAARRSYTITS